MSTKRFCDICNEPAVDQNRERIEASQRIGEPREDEEYNRIQTSVTVTAIFGFRLHPSGFGGPPDLCKDCRIVLLKQLLHQEESYPHH